MEEKIKTLLQEIQKAYSSISPDILSNNQTEKAEETEISAFEETIGEKLPEDYRFFLMHNTVRMDFCFSFLCLPLRLVRRQREMMNQLLESGTFANKVKQREKAGHKSDNRIKRVWWSPKWIPFAEDSAGNMYCIDLDPGREGKKYQIVNMELQDSQGPYCSDMFDSLLNFLEKHLGYLKNKQYTEEDGNITIDPYIKPME